MKFFRFWKEYWPSKPDWNEDAWGDGENGDSSLIGWLTWVAQPAGIDFDVLARCFEAIHRDTDALFGPELALVRRTYDAKLGMKQGTLETSLAPLPRSGGRRATPEEVHAMIEEQFAEQARLHRAGVRRSRKTDPDRRMNEREREIKP